MTFVNNNKQKQVIIDTIFTRNIIALSSLYFIKQINSNI